MKLLFASLLLFLSTGMSNDPAPIREWTIPYEDSRPRDPFVAPDGTVFFVGQRSHYIGHLNPATGDIKKYDLSDGAGPHNVIIDSKGMAWYAGNRDSHIGMLNPATGEITRYDMPIEAARDPHTLTFDKNENIWFTLQGSNMVGFFDRETKKTELIQVETPRSRPYGIVMDSKGTPWLNLFGTNKIASVDPETMTLTEYTLPRENARTRRIGIDSNDLVWYVDYAGGYVGYFDPSTKTFSEWQSPSGTESRPYAMAIDGEDGIWFVETGIQPNRFVKFDLATKAFSRITDVPSGGGTVRHMVYHQPTETIWFGADANTIGRIEVK